MKKELIFSVMLVCLVALGMVFMGCSDGSSESGDTAQFAGTWNASGSRSCTFSGNNFDYKVSGSTQYSGTFSVSGALIRFNVGGDIASCNFSLSGDTLTLSNHDYDSSVNGMYTKQ